MTLVASALVALCFATSTTPTESDVVLRPRLGIEGPQLGGEASPPELGFEVLRASSALERWAVARTTATGPRGRARQILRSLIEPTGQGLREIVAPTWDPPTAFERREANCVTLAALVVSLGRSQGVPLVFARLRRPFEGHRAGDLWVEEKHLVAAWLGGDRPWVYDFAGETAVDPRHLEPITDLTALALFASNRGIEAMLGGDSAAALRLLGRAVTLDPQLAEAWSNLGVVRRRLGDTEGARRAYEQALLLDPAEPTAYRNLAALLQAEGRRHEAADVLETGRDLVADDPFEVLTRARENLELGDLEVARGLYRRALDLATNPAQR